MTEQRLREIRENVGHQSVNNIGVKCYYPIAVQLAMKQAVNEAIDNYVELAHDRLCVTRSQLESIADQLKVK